MRALVLAEPGHIALDEVEIPTPGPGEVLVRVKAAPTCGTDLKAYLRGHPQIPMPGVFGHEYSGVVEASGPGAPFSAGDAVMGVHSAPCGSCYWCDNDQENLCEQIMDTKVLGSYAEYLLIPAHIARANLFAKPDSLSFERAALLEPLACVAHALGMLKNLRDQRVLVIGPGAIGLMFSSALAYLRVQDVTLAGRNPLRLKIGESLGARPYHYDRLDEIRGRGFDLVIECTGREEVWERSISLARRGGAVVLFGGCPTGATIQLDTARIHYDQISLISPFHFGTEAVRTARDWLLDRRLGLDLLISGYRELADGTRVFEDLRNGQGVKYVFCP
jgi:L-iditol 2-dehydrogenase